MPGVEGAGRRLGVVLDGECRRVLVADSLDCPVVQVDMGHLEAFGEPIREDCEVMVLGCDFDASAGEPPLSRLSSQPLKSVKRSPT